MRYIDPTKYIQKRFTDSFADVGKPNWRAAVICFKGLDSSGILINKIGAVPVKRKVLSGMDIEGDRPYLYEAKVNGKPVVVLSGCFWGGPQAAIVVEELACIGIKYIIGLGLAGSISRDLPKCAHIVASTGLTTDGTSRGYTKANSIGADDELLRILQSTQRSLKHEIIPVAIATVDAIYQETDTSVREWASLGAQAINMETTPLYAASAVCGVKSLWLGYISDCLVDNHWDDWYGLPESLDHDSAEITVALLESLLSK